MKKVKIDGYCECATCGKRIEGYAWHDSYTEALVCDDCKVENEGTDNE